MPALAARRLPDIASARLVTWCRPDPGRLAVPEARRPCARAADGPMRPVRAHDIAIAPRSDTGDRAQGSPPRSSRPDDRRVRVEDKRVINGAVRRQPAGAVQVQVGLGEVPGRLREPLDAAGSEHEPRHRDLWKDPNGLTDDERRLVKRNLGFFVTADSLAANNIVLGTYRHISAPECSAVPAAPGVRGGDPHPRVPVHRRVAGPGRRRDLQRLPRGQVDPGQGRVPDPVHRHADQPERSSHRHRRRTTRSC